MASRLDQAARLAAERARQMEVVGTFENLMRTLAPLGYNLVAKPAAGPLTSQAMLSTIAGPRRVQHFVGLSLRETVARLLDNDPTPPSASAFRQEEMFPAP